MTKNAPATYGGRGVFLRVPKCLENALQKEFAQHSVQPYREYIRARRCVVRV